MGRLVNLHEDILGDVFGLGGIAQGPVKQVYDRPLVFVNQLCKGATVALLDAQHQGRIGIQFGGHNESI